MFLKKQKSSSCNLLKQYNIKGQTKKKEKNAPQVFPQVAISQTNKTTKLESNKKKKK
jgi:hypothetical protein